MAEFTDADVELVAQTDYVACHRGEKTLADWHATDDADREDYRIDARAVLSALAAAGRLASPDADVATAAHESRVGRGDRGCHDNAALLAAYERGVAEGRRQAAAELAAAAELVKSDLLRAEQRRVDVAAEEVPGDA